MSDHTSAFSFLLRIDLVGEPTRESLLSFRVFVDTVYVKYFLLRNEI